jgi:tetratricopeptide (TPR) repeat protein
VALYQAGKFAEAVPLAQRVLAIAERALGSDHRDVATLLNNLAELCRRQGRYTDAEPLYKRALAIREKVPDPGHPDIATSRPRSTTWLCSITSKAATPMPSRSISKRWRSARKGSVPAIRRLRSCSTILLSFIGVQGRYAEAEALYKQALAIRERGLDPGRPDIATSLNDLALLYRVQGRYAEA